MVLPDSFGHRRCAAFGGGLLCVVDAIEDRPDLCEPLRAVDHADTGQRSQQSSTGMSGDRSAMTRSMSVIALCSASAVGVAGDHRGGYLAVLTPDPVGVVGVGDRMRIAQPGARTTTDQVPLGI